MRGSMIAIGLSVASLALTGCDKTVSLCSHSPESDSCRLELSTAKTEFDILRGDQLIVEVNNREDASQAVFTAALQPQVGDAMVDRNALPIMLSATLVDSKDTNNHKYKLTPMGGASLRIGAYTLTVQQGDRQPATKDIKIVHPLKYNLTPIVLNAPSPKTDPPWIEYLGIAKGSIFGLGSGFNGAIVGGDIKRIRRCVWNKENSSVTDAGIDYAAGSLGKTALLAVGRANIYLSQEPGVYMEKMLRCNAGSNPQKTDCTALNYLLPMNSQVMVVSPDEGQIVRASDQGMLQWGLPSMAPMGWNNVTSTVVAAPETKVRAAMGDVDGDTHADLVAVWQGSTGQQARVLVWNGSSFVEDKPKSDQLEKGLGTGTIEALAVGDVDGDGYADVVYGRGRDVVVLQNQLNAFAPAENGRFEGALSDEKIGAVAVGKVDGSTEIGKGLDIVVATNTPYDMSNQSTLTLRVFRPQ